MAKSSDVTDQFDSLVAGMGGAAPMDADLANAAGKRAGIQVGGTYGMSETTGSVCTLPRGIADETGSVGIRKFSSLLNFLVPVPYVASSLKCYLVAVLREMLLKMDLQPK